MRRVAECRVRLNCKLNPMFWQNSVEAKLSRRDDGGDECGVTRRRRARFCKWSGGAEGVRCMISQRLRQRPSSALKPH